MTPQQAHPLQGIALHLAADGREIDAGMVAQALGQNPTKPTASAYRTTAADLLDRMTRAGLLRRHGKHPRCWWTAAA